MKGTKPEWLRVRVRSDYDSFGVMNMLQNMSLHTVCEEANCPNLCECFSRKTATFLILGKVCTRNCTFCNVTKGHTTPLDEEEPINVAKAVQQLKLKHVVITSVTRDDLPDGGAAHFARVIEEVRKLNDKVVIEVLIPDFKGDASALQTVINAKPEIINHNIETIPRLYDVVRPMASYERSLELLRNVKTKNGEIYSKSGIMVGLGEKEAEVIDVMKDLRNVGCDMLTIGQYLAPSKEHHPVVEYIHPDIFEKYKKIADGLGFMHVASAPLVRSSYMADKFLDK
jgi:lipoyl synthase